MKLDTQVINNSDTPYSDIPFVLTKMSLLGTERLPKRKKHPEFFGKNFLNFFNIESLNNHFFYF